MKKSIFAVLCAVVMLVGFAAPAFAAGTTLTINAPELPAVGEKFYLQLDIAGNPGFNLMTIYLDFDEKVVDCLAIASGEVTDNMTFMPNTDAPDGYPCIAAISLNSVSSDGAVANFEFMVLAAGDPGFKLTGSYLADGNNTRLSVTFVGESAGGGSPDVPTDEPGDNPGGDPVIIIPDDPTPIKPDPAIDDDDPVTPSFTDLNDGHWAFEYVEAAHAAGYIDGYSDGTFRPSKNMTRAEFVTLLWKMAGKPKATSSAGFADVKSGDWFADAVNWAAENGIVKGKTATEFKPNGNITRQEIVLILFNYDGGRYDVNPLFLSIYNGMPDSGRIADWAKNAFYWGIYHGIVAGSDGLLKPTGLATRAQVATMIARFAGLMGETGSAA